MKNKLSVNVFVDILMLVALSLTSFSGFIIKVAIPSCCAMKFGGVVPLCRQFCGMGRHAWSEIHVWTSIILLVLFLVHVSLHNNMVVSHLNRHCTNKVLLVILYVIVAVLILLATVPWIYYLLS